MRAFRQHAVCQLSSPRVSRVPVDIVANLESLVEPWREAATFN